MPNLRNRKLTLCVIALALVCLTGCPASTPSTSTPAAPTPPQITVANAVNALVSGVDGVVNSAIAARNAGKMDPSDVAAIESYCKVVLLTAKQVDADLRSPDPWASQKVKILTLVSQAGLGTLKAHISPAAQVTVSTVVIIVNKILAAVGGPTL